MLALRASRRVSSLLGGGRQDALLDGLQQIGQALFCVPELLFQNREAGVFLALGFQNQIG